MCIASNCAEFVVLWCIWLQFTLICTSDVFIRCHLFLNAFGLRYFLNLPVAVLKEVWSWQLSIVSSTCHALRHFMTYPISFFDNLYTYLLNCFSTCQSVLVQPGFLVFLSRPATYIWTHIGKQSYLKFLIFYINSGLNNIAVWLSNSEPIQYPRA